MKRVAQIRSHVIKVSYVVTGRKHKVKVYITLQSTASSSISSLGLVIYLHNQQEIIFFYFVALPSPKCISTLYSTELFELQALLFNPICRKMKKQERNGKGECLLFLREASQEWYMALSLTCHRLEFSDIATLNYKRGWKCGLNSDSHMAR